MFQNQMEGSKLYTNLLNQARDFYCSTLINGNESAKNLNVGSRIRRMLEDIDVDIEKLKNEEKYVQKSQGLNSYDCWDSFIAL